MSRNRNRNRSNLATVTTLPVRPVLPETTEPLPEMYAGNVTPEPTPEPATITPEPCTVCGKTHKAGSAIAIKHAETVAIAATVTTPEPTPEPATVTPEPCTVCGKTHKPGSAVAIKHAATVTPEPTPEPATVATVDETFTPEQRSARVAELDREARDASDRASVDITALGMAMANMVPFAPWGDGSARDYFDRYMPNMDAFKFGQTLRRDMIVAAYAYGNKPSMDTLKALTRASERTLKDDRVALGYFNQNMVDGQADRTPTVTEPTPEPTPEPANPFATLQALTALSDEFIIKALETLGTERCAHIGAALTAFATVKPAGKRAGK